MKPQGMFGLDATKLSASRGAVCCALNNAFAQLGFVVPDTTHRGRPFHENDQTQAVHLGSNGGAEHGCLAICERKRSSRAFSFRPSIGRVRHGNLAHGLRGKAGPWRSVANIGSVRHGCLAIVWNESRNRLSACVGSWAPTQEPDVPEKTFHDSKGTWPEGVAGRRGTLPSVPSLRMP